MIKLAGYLKPFFFGLIIAVLLLFAQALCDLNLPNFMSRIVNVGIQQHGIEHSTPRAISKEGYRFITIFMSDQEKALMDASYSLASGADKNKEGKLYRDVYPAAAEEQIYILEDSISGESLAQLDAAFGWATWTMINVLKSFAGEQESSRSMEPVDMQSADITQLYKMHPLLAQLPQHLFDEARQQAQAMDHSLLAQSGTMLAAVFYRDLGMDLEAYQRSYIIG
ncbi:MAG: ABC transporter ATP-binding protein, partial [Firmicutes bacterium]|nr:ABC transporter ATP-binding protein [Bacillota bacterium]